MGAREAVWAPDFLLSVGDRHFTDTAQLLHVSSMLVCMAGWLVETWGRRVWLALQVLVEFWVRVGMQFPYPNEFLVVNPRSAAGARMVQSDPGQKVGFVGDGVAPRAVQFSSRRFERPFADATVPGLFAAHFLDVVGSMDSCRVQNLCGQLELRIQLVCGVLSGIDPAGEFIQVLFILCLSLVLDDV